jgi:hypothetical protein
LGPQIDLLGCEYLGGCPAVGPRVLNKVEMHFDPIGLTIAVAPQGLFTLAAAHPVLTLTWPEITVLSATTIPSGRPPLTPGRVARRALDVLTMRLDLPDRLRIGTEEWTMTVGVRMAADELAESLRQLLAGSEGPTPVVTAN